jgi:hypothetical protein
MLGELSRWIEQAVYYVRSGEIPKGLRCASSGRLATDPVMGTDRGIYQRDVYCRSTQQTESIHRPWVMHGPNALDNFRVKLVKQGARHFEKNVWACEKVAEYGSSAASRRRARRQSAAAAAGYVSDGVEWLPTLNANQRTASPMPLYAFAPSSFTF